MGPSWYFKRGLWSLFTIPLFLFLSWLLVFDIISTIIQNLGLVRALSAVYGLPGRIAFFLFGWIPAMLPTVLCFLLLKKPGLWVRQDENHSTKVLISTGFLVAFLLVGSLGTLGTSLSTSWIADRDPCAAYAAGVTGSVRPENCDQAAPEEKKSFWSYLFKLFIGSMLTPIIFSFLMLPLYYLQYLTLKKENAKLTILIYPLLAVSVVGQIYFWGLWAAYCSAITASYASSPG